MTAPGGVPPTAPTPTAPGGSSPGPPTPTASAAADVEPFGPSGPLPGASCTPGNMARGSGPTTAPACHIVPAAVVAAAAGSFLRRRDGLLPTLLSAGCGSSTVGSMAAAESAGPCRVAEEPPLLLAAFAPASSPPGEPNGSTLKDTLSMPAQLEPVQLPDDVTSSETV